MRLVNLGTAAGTRGRQLERGGQGRRHASSRSLEISHVVAAATAAGCSGRWTPPDGSGGTGPGQEEQLVHCLLPRCPRGRLGIEEQEGTDSP